MKIGYWITLDFSVMLWQIAWYSQYLCEILKAMICIQFIKIGLVLYIIATFRV